MLSRSARRAGRTIRRLTDCLVAAVALRHGDPVVHREEDFAVLAEVADLPVVDSRRPSRIGTADRTRSGNNRLPKLLSLQ